MTATVESILDVARSQLGYVESGGPDGRSGNITRYWAALAPSYQGAPWCAAFQRWVNIKAGGPDLPIALPYYCPAYVIYAKKHGLWDASGHYSPGDLVLFDWDGAGVADHIGRVEADDGKVITTIEGNAQSGVAADRAEDPSNGGGVYRRQRPHGPSVMGVLAYSRLLAAPAAPRLPVRANPYAARAGFCRYGSRGDAVRFVQWACGIPVDGIFGPQTLKAVTAFQTYHHLLVDGIVGPQTIGALRGVTH